MYRSVKVLWFRAFQKVNCFVVTSRGGSRILKRGGQEEAEGVSCRSECGCSRNAAALGRSLSCLGGSGGTLPRKILKIQLSKYAFLRIWRVSTVCQAEGNALAASTDPLTCSRSRAYRPTRSLRACIWQARSLILHARHDCALLSIEKKIEARLKGGAMAPLAPRDPSLTRI